MLITKQSSFTNKMNTMDIAMTQDTLDLIQEGGSMIHLAPTLSVAECEFLFSGVTPEEMRQLN